MTCTIGNNGFDLASFTAIWNFGNDTWMDVPARAGVVSAFHNPWGAPFVFNCTFADCTPPTVEGTVETTACQQTNCYCSTWCGKYTTRPIIDGWHGSVSFYCDITTGECSIKGDKLPIVLSLQCDAAGCQAPQVSSSGTGGIPGKTLALIISLSAGGLLLIVGTALTCVYLARRQRAPRHSLQLLSEDSVQTTLSWYNISCSVPGHERKYIVHHVSGLAQPGTITAIMGPSGAGKTSFLDILAGRKNTGEVTGPVLVNGHHRTKTFKRISGYVLQEERMLGTLTVREHLTYVAELRLPSSMPYTLKMRRVQCVLQDLGIEHIAESVIGTDMSRGISGGERRRLSIAAELVTDPAILFLDEPTSGLDSYSAHGLMQTLMHLARTKKRTILMSIHQPGSNIFALFDNLLLLCHGKQVYWGPARAALDHFEELGHPCPENYNPADHFIDTVQTCNEEEIKTLCKKYQASPVAQELKNALTSIQAQDSPADTRPDMHLNGEYASSWLKQCYMLSKRTLLNNLRNPYLLRTQYSLTILLAALIGIIFWKSDTDINGIQNRLGCMFFLVSLLAFASMSSIDTFFQERAVFLRERANGMYRTSAYFVSKALCDVIPMRVIPPLLLGAIVYYMIGLREGAVHFVVFLSVLVLVSLVSGSMSLAISSAIPSLSVGNLIAVLLLLFYMLFGGFLLSKTSMPSFIKPLKLLSFINYGFEILAVDQLNDFTVNFNPGDYDPIFINGNVILAQFGMDASRFVTDFISLGVMTAVYMLISYLFLRFGVKEKR